jgi:hypothetical protein
MTKFNIYAEVVHITKLKTIEANSLDEAKEIYEKMIENKEVSLVADHIDDYNIDCREYKDDTMN